MDLPQRPRRLRRTPVLRDLVAENRVHPDQLVMPHFCLNQESAREAIDSMPGIERLGRKELVEQVRDDLALGIRSVLLFGLASPGEKNATGSHSSEGAGAVPLAVTALKAEFGNRINVITDVCLCAYTDHGHCGVIEKGEVRNDPSLDLLANMALAHAIAGADVIAPSDMMDGRVEAIREVLDGNGFENIAIMSYSAKYASAYYGPFRDAADSAPSDSGDVPKDRKTYQMDARNRWEARREANLDEMEGADILMVKPGLAYLDIVAEVDRMTDLPVAVYNVSGEYSMVKAAAERGWIDEPAVVSENLHAFVRAGADIIITYHAREALAGEWI
ncbi:MAG: porphobilinogen synthase [Bacteroidia bacterium]|jgi:porphobilinogen synthase